MSGSEAPSSGRSEFDQILVEIDEDPEYQEDENHARVDCRYCDEEHLGKLGRSPPDGFYVKWYCTNVERRGRRSVP